MSTFSYAADYGASLTAEPKVRSVKFGDGYEQRQKYGINTTQEAWNLTFAQRDQADTEAIIGFFEDAGAVTAFDWTAPGESSAKKWICRSWNKTIERGNRFTITAQFDRVYDP